MSGINIISQSTDRLAFLSTASRYDSTSHEKYCLLHSWASYGVLYSILYRHTYHVCSFEVCLEL